MENKKLIILIILGITAVISLIYGLLAQPSRRHSPAAPRAMSAAVKEPAMPRDAAISAERRAVRSKHAAWRRSPFAPIGTPAAASALSLRGIMWNAKNPKAMFGDAIAGKGDKVGNNTVVDIKKDRVILNDGTKEFELKINK